MADEREALARLLREIDDAWEREDLTPVEHMSHPDYLARWSGFAADAVLAADWRPPPEPQAPGHTDLMVSPESIDAFMEASPLPPEPQADREARARAGCIMCQTGRELINGRSHRTDAGFTIACEGNGIRDAAQAAAPEVVERARAYIAAFDGKADPEDVPKIPALNTVCRAVIALAARVEAAERRADAAERERDEARSGMRELERRNINQFRLIRGEREAAEAAVKRLTASVEQAVAALTFRAGLIEALTTGQRQIDQDGVEIAVSHEALCGAIEGILNARAALTPAGGDA